MESMDQTGSAKERVTLKRNLGLFGGCSLIIGMMVGSGIFISPKGVLIYSGSVGMSIIVWILAGFISLLGALCYAEIGTVIPKDGGTYVYLMEAYGNLAGYLYMWSSVFILQSAGNSVIALTFGYYVLQLVFPNCNPSVSAAILLACLLIALLTYINCASIQLAIRIQAFLSSIKMLALVVICLTGVVYLAKGKTTNLENPFEGTNPPAVIAVGFYSGLYSYSGWYCLNCVVEELQNPYRNLPLAMIISVTTVTIAYVMTNITYFILLTPSEIVASHAVALSAATQVSAVGPWIMCVVAVCATIGSLNTCILCSGRTCFAGAREGHLPRVVSYITLERFSPTPGIILQSSMMIIMTFVGDPIALINYTIFIEALANVFCVVALFIFRRTKPDVPRPIKIPLVIPIVYLVLSVFILAMSIYTGPLNSLLGLLTVSSGIPFYIFGVAYKRKPKSFTKAMSSFTILLQKVLLACPEDKEA